MFRLYYNPDTGEIIKGCTASIANPKETLPSIDVPLQVRMCDYRVNTLTGQLIHDPQPVSEFKR
jgi:hypothetical protein